jgi:hypothetical protein
MSAPIRWRDDPDTPIALRTALEGLPAAPALPPEVADAIAGRLRAHAVRRSTATGKAGAAIAGTSIVLVGIAIYAMLGADDESRDPRFKAERPATPIEASESAGDRIEAPRATSALAEAHPLGRDRVEAPQSTGERGVVSSDPPARANEDSLSHAGDAEPASVATRERGRAGGAEPASIATRERGREPGPSRTAQPESDTLGAEAELLARAQRELARDPSRARALALEHERVFPAGRLVEEREAVMIDALVRLGRIDDARARAQDAAARFPRGFYEERIERLLGRSR